MSSFKFDGFFDETIEYPGANIGGGTILPPGTLYSYVNSTFLCGMINYAGKVIGAYVL
jgi:hypothetical protein